MNWDDIKSTAKDLATAPGFLHLSFWLLTYLFLFIIDNRDLPNLYKLIDNLVDISFFIFISYINIYYLIPKFLQNKKPLLYMLSLIGMAFLLSPILTSAYLLIYRNFLDEVSTRLEFKNTAFIICLFVGLASMLFKVTKDWLIHQQERKELESQKLQSELKFLKSQIDPHFFFNTLNNLYALTLKKSDLAPEIVLRLSEMMRYMLYECNELKVPLDKEIKYLQNYIELEKLRQGDNFEISFNVKGEARDKVIAPLVFIPFLENSFKHGVNNQIKSGFVNINMDLTDNDVMMSIENSKITSLNDRNLIKKSGGIGLKNVKRRLKLIYPNSHNIDIIDKANSFKVLLDIKLN